MFYTYLRVCKRCIMHKYSLVSKINNIYIKNIYFLIKEICPDVNYFEIISFADKTQIVKNIYI